MPFLARFGAVLGVLVLLAIGAIALAILLPALSRRTEAADKMLCGSNLRQLGIAAHNYHNDYKRLPPGYYGPYAKASDPPDLAYDPQRGPWVGCLVPLLPYLEQDQVFKCTCNTPRTFPALPAGEEPPQPLGLALEVERAAWWTVPRNLEVGRTRIKMLLCPADNDPAPPEKGGLRAVHVGGNTPVFLKVGEGPADLGWTNYTGVAGACGILREPYEGDGKTWAQWEGVLANRSGVGLTQLSTQDGCSNTLMFGEGLGGTGGATPDHAWSWFGVGAMGTAYGLGKAGGTAPSDPPPLTLTGPTAGQGQDGAAWYRFSSRHAAVVQFCFGDCSVRGLRFGSTTTANAANGGNNPSDWAILQQLAGRKDGFNNDTTSLLD